MFSIGYPLMAVPVLVLHGVVPGEDLLEGLPRDPDELSGLVLTVFALLPSAVYVTWAAEGREGVRRLFRRAFRWDFGVGWWVFILTAMPALTVVAGLLLGDSLRPVHPGAFLLTQAGQLLVNLLLVNLWEETAWAGVLQTRLERRHNVFVAALLTAVPFGFAHWPLAFLGEFTATSAVVSLGAYIVLGVLVRPLAGLTMRGTRDSVLAFALVHTLFNRTNNPDGIPGTLLDGNGNGYGLVGVVLLLTVTVALIVRRRLGTAYRSRLDQQSAASTAGAPVVRSALEQDAAPTRSPH
ncbi:type II CAAX endopeptidase family protein [Geodermatophilus tzadiensis]|uniref:type II CAAX endopeptidase family protein n=1 Tax=Geodermatophilus tzadiensis TaxID=1137988 RepID=UPI0011B1E9D9|nr:type II CAAX endopeptidase family protein [Geodermatophilus tzadiensis]